MARHPLQVLLRLRGIDLDMARRALAERLREAAAAEERCAGIAATIAREAEVQLNQPDECRTVASYAVWLACAVDAQREAAAATTACSAATAAARVELNEARAGTRALESALEQLHDTARDEAVRVEQRALDEAAAVCKRPGRWSG